MFKIQYLSNADLHNIYKALDSVESAYECNSAIFAGICYRLAGYYADMFAERFHAAANDWRISKEERVNLRDKRDHYEDCTEAWGRRFYALLDGNCMKLSRAERRRHRQQSRLFTKLLFKHWDEANGLWTFGKVNFG